MKRRVVPITTSDGTLAVEFRGRGPRVLLLHGLSGSRRGWDRVVDRLDGQFTLVMPDLLSRGESEVRPELSYSLSREANRIRELVSRLEPRPRLLAGHSQGATLALALCEELGMSGVVLASPVTPWTRRPRILAVLRWRPLLRALAGVARPLRRPFTYLVLRRVFGPDTPVTRELVEKYAAPYADPRRTVALMRIVSHWRPQDMDERLLPAPLEIPGLVLVGAHDPRVLPKHAARLAARLDVPLWTASGVGHVLPDEAPELMARAIRTVAERALDASSRKRGVAPPGA